MNKYAAQGMVAKMSGAGETDVQAGRVLQPNANASAAALT